jgi:hypothetical protein
MASKIFSVRPCATAELLCQYDEPVFNLTVGNFTTPAEKKMALGTARPATMKEINAYRMRKSPHTVTDLNRR